MKLRRNFNKRLAELKNVTDGLGQKIKGLSVEVTNNTREGLKTLKGTVIESHNKREYNILNWSERT